MSQLFNTNNPGIGDTGGVTLEEGLILSNLASLTYSPGDILYINSSSEFQNLAVSTNGYVLTLVGGFPVWAAASGGSGGHVIEDEGTPLTQRANMNFVGSGVTVTDAGGKTVVTIPGGGGGAVDSVNGETGTVILTTDDISDAAQTNKWATAAEKTKLGFISVTQAVDLDALETASHVAVTVTDSAEINFTLTGQDITANIIAGSIDETKLDASTNASLDLADSAVQPAALSAYELLSNKATDFSTVNDTKYPTVEAVQEYVTSAVIGLLDYRGTYDASTNLYPATGGSGLAGAILKGDFYIVSVAGTLGGTAVTAGDLVIALVDTPAQTSSNWDIVSNELGYTPENAANKVTSVSGASTDTQYPSAKLVYDQLLLKAAALGGDDNYVTDAEKAALHAAVTVTDSSEINFTITGQDITASIIAGSIDEAKLDVSTNASLDLADSAVQPNDDVTLGDLTVDSLTTFVNNLRYTDNGVGRGDLGFSTFNNGTDPWGGALEFYNSASASNKGYITLFIGNATNNALLRIVAHDGDNLYDQLPLTLTQTGVLTVSDSVVVPDEAYDATTWNGSLEVPTKNAIRDKIETMGGGVSDGDKGDITVTASGATWTIDNNAVTFAKMQAITDGRLLGASGGTAVEEITIGSGLSLAANTLSATGGGGGLTQGQAVAIFTGYAMV